MHALMLHTYWAGCHLRLLCVFYSLTLTLTFSLALSRSQVGMPTAYYLHDCHYFYRTALRGLNVNTCVSPLYA